MPVGIGWGAGAAEYEGGEGDGGVDGAVCGGVELAG